MEIKKNLFCILNHLQSLNFFIFHNFLLFLRVFYFLYAAVFTTPFSYLFQDPSKDFFLIF